MGRPRLYANDREKWRVNKHDQRHPPQRHVPASQIPGTYVTAMDALLTSGQRFGTIYADPPWPYANQGTRGSTRRHYASMPLEAICALPVAALAAAQAHLHLWVPMAFLYESARVFDAWGFPYAGSGLVWRKPQMGLGNYWRLEHELLLLGVRGALVAQQKNLRSWLDTPRTAHSVKPERVRDLVEQLSPGPYLELFGRAAVPGWTVWGNECLPTTGRLFKDRTG